jgi:CRP-like cAMP-binding protein
MGNGDPALEEHLAHIFLFSGLDEEHRRQLAAIMTVKQYLPDDRVLTEGHDSFHGGMGVVLSGRLTVMHPGREIVSRLGAGEIFGELSLLDDLPRSATLEAEEPTEVALLSRGAFRAQIRENPDIALRLMKILSTRLRAAHGEHPPPLDQSY